MYLCGLIALIYITTLHLIFFKIGARKTLTPSLRRRHSKPSVDYTNGLDEYVGRLQRRLLTPCFTHLLILRKKNLTVFAV